MSIQDPSEETTSGHQRKNAIAVWSRNGRFDVSPERYMDIVETFKPDMYVTLADSDTDINSSNKRIFKAIERSKIQFEQCLQIHLKSDVLNKKGFLGSVQGGYDLKAREQSIKYMEDKPLLGYLIDGIHKNGKNVQNISIDQVKAVIKHSLVSYYYNGKLTTVIQTSISDMQIIFQNLLPVERLKVLTGCWNPVVILDLVDLGVDLFDSSYAYLITEESKALVFLCNNCQEKYSKSYINLFEKR